MSESKKVRETQEKKDLNIIKLKKGETVDLSKALGSSKRLKILKYTAEEELNLSEIAEKINSTPQAVYHHLQILEKSKLIRVVREEKIKNMDKTIKFYRSNFHPEAINLILWAPLDNLDFEQLQERVPLSKLPIERIARKIANVMFEDKTEYKTDILTKVLEGMINETHHSMQALKEEYELELDEKLWNLMLLFSQLSVLNAFKKTIENEKLKKNFDDLVALLAEEMFEEQLVEKKEIE